MINPEQKYKPFVLVCFHLCLSILYKSVKRRKNNNSEVSMIGGIPVS